MTYAEFKTFCMTHLWKMGDSVVIDALDTIIVTAEAELNRTFKVEDRTVSVPLIASTPSTPLPSDYRELRHFYSPSRGEMKYLIPADFANRKAANQLYGNNFTVIKKSIVLPYSPNAEQFECWYYQNLTPFSSIPDGTAYWIVDDYFDVYLYCVLKHTAPFLREDERIQVWEKMFGDAFGSAMNENVERKYAGSPLKMKFSRGIR